MQGIKSCPLEPSYYAYKRAQTVRVSPLYEHDLADLWIFLTCRWMSSQPNSVFVFTVIFTVSFLISEKKDLQRHTKNLELLLH